MDELKELLNSDPLKSWWPYIFSGLIGLAITIRNYAGGKSYVARPDHRNRWFIVTGANGGIGKEVCKELATRGANVILACRTLDENTQRVVRSLKKKFPNSEFELKFLDLASFKSVRKFVAEIGNLHRNDGIYGLINLAGIMFNPFEITEDGFEAHLQTNYLGHLLLTILMVPFINKKDGRIVNVSAHAYSSGRIKIEDPLNLNANPITGIDTFHARDAFSHSKLAIILATQFLARKLERSKITINSCTPGLVRGTGHFKRSPIMSALCAKVLTYPWMWLLMRSPNQGAQTIVYLAMEPSLAKISGEYFNDCERSDVNFQGSEQQLESLMRASLEAIQVTEINLKQLETVD